MGCGFDGRQTNEAEVVIVVMFFGLNLVGEGLM